MISPTIACPECDTRQEVETDEYGIFELQCGECSALSKGEYSNASDQVVWRWVRSSGEVSD